MRFLIPIVVFTLLITANLRGQALSYMSISVNEDMRILGVNKSFILITESDGTQKEIELERAINVNIKVQKVSENEKKLLEALNQYAQKGWKILNVNSFSIEDDGTTFINSTRYLLEKKVE